MWCIFLPDSSHRAPGADGSEGERQLELSSPSSVNTCVAWKNVRMSSLATRDAKSLPPTTRMKNVCDRVKPDAKSVV